MSKKYHDILETKKAKKAEQLKAGPITPAKEEDEKPLQQPKKKKGMLEALKDWTG